MFLIAAFVGWLYEIICVFVMYGVYYDRGILHLPLCPIYGIGMFVIYGLFHRIKNKGFIFIGSALIATLVELVTSYVAEYKFHVIMWTYEGWPLNFQNRISAISSIIFGLMAVLFMWGIYPVIHKIYLSKYKWNIAIITVVFTCLCIGWELRFVI